VATVSVNVGDVDGDSLVVVWSLDGTATQTNQVVAGGPPTSASVDFTAFFAAGTHQVAASVTEPGGCSASCSTTVTVLSNTPPTITCPSPVTLKCAPSAGEVATVSVNVADADGDPLVVVWTVDGAVYRTNLVAGSAGGTAASVTLTAPFTVGSHMIGVSVSDPSGCEAACMTMVTVIARGDLYPIALHTNSLVGVPVGGTIPDIYNGSQSGNFGWLTWAGNPSEPTLVRSLRPPGNSSTYVNPANKNDHFVAVGDWVQGKAGISNSQQVRQALDVIKQIDITVPVWDKATGKGNNSLYHVVGFAKVRITDYQLPKQNRITAKFLGFTDCR
jgi:hypothetical protein